MCPGRLWKFSEYLSFFRTPTAVGRRSSVKNVMKIFVKFSGMYLCRGHFFNKLQVLSREFPEFFQTIVYFLDHLTETPVGLQMLIL